MPQQTNESDEELWRRLQRERFENDETGDSIARLINADREHTRKDYQYEKEKAEYLRDKAQAERYAG